MMRKKLLINTLTALALLAASPIPAAEDQTPTDASGRGQGMQHGMMGGGMGPGMMGHGMMGMGPGMGMGQGMMGMGPGMMGMMDDGCPGGGSMMGPGMMRPGMGMMGMGPGMMGGYNPGGALKLNEQQQKKITQIQDELRKKHWGLMGKMNDEQVKLRDLYTSDKRDPTTIGQQQQRIYDLRRQMVESSVEAQNRMEAVLTPEQKEQWRGYYGQSGMMW